MGLKVKIKENIVVFLVVGAITFIAGGFGTYALNSLGKTQDLDKQVQATELKLSELYNKVNELSGKDGTTDITLLRLEKAITRLETIVERLERRP